MNKPLDCDGVELAVGDWVKLPEDSYSPKTASGVRKIIAITKEGFYPHGIVPIGWLELGDCLYDPAIVRKIPSFRKSHKGGADA